MLFYFTCPLGKEPTERASLSLFAFLCYLNVDIFLMNEECLGQTGVQCTCAAMISKKNPSR